MGASAGGCLSAHAALAAAHPSPAAVVPEFPVSAEVQGLVSLWGPMDFVARWFDNGGRPGAEVNLFHTDYEKNPSAYHTGSPLTYVTGNAPPALFVHAENDRTVHPRQSRLAHAAWLSAGVESELFLVKDLGHTTHSDADQLKAINKISDWLGRRLNGL